MASIEEQLARDEWNPQPLDQLIGEIVSISLRVAKSGSPYPVLVVRDDGDSTEYIVSCALFATDVINRRPAAGDRVGIKFWGPQPRSDGDGSFDRYTIAFEKEAAEVDWDAMAHARGMTTASATEAGDPPATV